MTTARKALGDAGEELACAFLTSGGYRIVARNHRSRRGEVDIVAEKGELLVFVEVRTRSASTFGGPEETVRFRKQQRFILAAQDFLMRWRGPRRGARFDVVAVVGGKIAHYENAFDAS